MAGQDDWDERQRQEAGVHQQVLLEIKIGCSFSQVVRKIAFETYDFTFVSCDICWTF